MIPTTLDEKRPEVTMFIELGATLFLVFLDYHDLGNGGAGGDTISKKPML